MEHKLITGGEQYLPFARSRIKAMRATGLMFASQQFEIDGCSIKVRIEGDHEFITLSGGGHVSAFPDIQYPEVDVVKAKVLNGVARTGTFPATVIDSGGYYPTAVRRTRFGTSPYNTHHLRKSQNVVTQFNGLTYGAVTRAGVVIGGTSYYDIFLDGVHIERVTTSSPWGGGGSETASWESNSSEYTPCIVSGSRAVLATIEITAAETKYVTLTIDGYINDTELSHGAAGTNTHGGQSSIKLRIVRSTEAGPTCDAVVVAPLPYSRDEGITTGLLDFAELGQWQFLNTIYDTTNDVECPNYRRWHAKDRISTGHNNAVFVLRETSTMTATDSRWVAPVIYVGFTAVFTRGYTLSFVSPDRQVQNHVVTGDLGPHGYIDGVFPSGDNKYVYVYYGIHDVGETLTINATTFRTFTPTQYNEYLDEISVTKNGNAYTLTKVRTISLGHVTLRNHLPLYHRSDHFESKLHGATLEVSGYIWADRYCYNLKTGEFAEIPDFVEFPPPYQNPELGWLPDQITGPEDDRTSYLKVSGDGTQAMYTMFKTGTVACYTARKNPATGAFEVVAGRTSSVGTAYSWGEYLDGLAAQYT